MRCEGCAAPLPLQGPRPRACPRCKAFLHAKEVKGRTVEVEAAAGGRTGTAAFALDRLEATASKAAEPGDLLPIELFRCPLCGHGIVLATMAEPVRDGARFLLRLPRKRTVEVRCDYCGRPNRALAPAEDPLEVPVVPLKKDSFEYQLDQFLRLPPPPAAPERSGCLGLFLFFSALR